MAHIRQSSADFDLGFQVKFLKALQSFQNIIPQAAANTDGQGAAESSERVCVSIARVASAADTGHRPQHNA